MKYFDDIVNPIAEARLADGYSLKRLGNKLGMSAQYISRAEHGTYSDLNRELVKYTADVLGIPSKAMIDRYKNFQSETRRRTARQIQPKRLIRGTSLRPGFEIFKTWREVYWPSPVAFSNAFCVHPETVTPYEDGIRDVMPNQMVRALQHVRLIEDNWTEKPVPGQRPRLNVFGPMARREIDEENKREKASPANYQAGIVIPIPGQRRSEPF